MWPSVPASSTFIRPPRAVSFALRATAASWRAMSVERLRTSGLGGYLAIWMLRPVFELGIAALIYGTAHPVLLRYVVVALAANAFVFNTIFYVGEILDRERMNGTLVGLFLAPCPRLSWLSGFTLVGLVETALIAAVTLIFGHVAFGVRYDPDVPALALALGLFLASLWGLGFVFSAIGLLIKKANQLSNLIYPFTVLLGGVYYPVALLPNWLRYPARALPLGYGMQALADATLYHKSIPDLAPQLLPLAGFALVLPFAGAFAFRLLERLVRERGELDLY
jgi:ABC-2 type transport system permease protein